MRLIPWLVGGVLVIGAGCSSDAATPAEPTQVTEIGSSKGPTPEVGAVDAGTVEVGGSPIRFQRSGDASPPRITFLFLHGAAFTSDTWVENNILEASARASNFGAVAIDLPGYGESPSTSLPSDEFVPTVMSALGLEPATTVIISPSMSGGFSLGALRSGSLDDLAGFVGVAPVGSSEFAGSLPTPIDVPAVAVWGDSDGADPQSSAQALADGFVDGAVAVLANAGHAAYNQQPEAFTVLLRDFANGLPACDEACLD